MQNNQISIVQAERAAGRIAIRETILLEELERSVEEIQRLHKEIETMKKDRQK